MRPHPTRGAGAASYPPRHVLRPRSLRRHRRPGVAKADAGAVPGLAARQAARRRPHPRRFAPGARRRRLPRLAEGALRRGRGREAAERRGVRPLRRPAPYLRLDLSKADDYQRLKGVAGLERRPRQPGRRRRHVPGDEPRPLPGRLRAARRRRPQRARTCASCSRSRSATTSRARSRSTASCARCSPRTQAYRIDHYLGKPAVQNLTALRFGNVLFEPLWRRECIANMQITIAETIGVGTRGDFYSRTGALRDMIQNHALQLLTMVAMEPPPRMVADAIRDEKLKVLRSLKRFQHRQRRPRRRARPVPRRQHRLARRAGLSRGRERAAGEPDRNLRRPAHRGAELALGRRAVLPAHRQAPRRARRADRRQLPADAAHAFPRRRTAPTSWSSSCSPKTASSCTCSRPRAPASRRRSRRSRSTSTSTRPSPRTASAPTSGCCSTSSPADSTSSCAATSRKRRGAGSSRSCRPGATTTPAPRPYMAGTWGPAAASALVARDGFAWSEEE